MAKFGDKDLWQIWLEGMEQPRPVGTMPIREIPAMIAEEIFWNNLKRGLNR